MYTKVATKLYIRIYCECVFCPLVFLLEPPLDAAPQRSILHQADGRANCIEFGTIIRNFAV